MKSGLATACALLSLLISFPAFAQDDGKPCFAERRQLRESAMRDQRLDARLVIACYTRALETGSVMPADVEAVYANRASLHALTGNYELAIGDLDRAIALNNGGSILAFWLSERCFYKSMVGRLSEALADCDRALSRQPDDAGALLYRGLIHLKSRDNAKALRDYEKIVQRGVPTNPANLPLYHEALYGRGIARLRSGDLAGGEADMAATGQERPLFAAKFSQRGVDERK